MRIYIMNLCIFTYVHTQIRTYIQTQDNKTQKSYQEVFPKRNHLKHILTREI